MTTHESFNQSGFAKFINSPAGRILRVVLGIGFIAVGYAYRNHTLGVISLIWGLFPLSAGLLDICYISAALGGPLSGKKIRARQIQFHQV
jgi:hypothetical protein